MTGQHVKFVILLPLMFSMGIAPFQAGLCNDCANEGEVCSIKEGSTFSPCCPKDRITNIELKCNPDSEDIGTCVEKKKEEKEEK